MPSSVAAANPTLVMPYSLAIAWQRSRAWAVNENVYRAGEVQREAQVSTSRKTWTISKALTTAEMNALRAFYVSVDGPMDEFWFYDLWETVPPLSQAGYDETAAATDGRYAVRLEGKWSETLLIPRHTTDLVLVEVS